MAATLDEEVKRKKAEDLLSDTSSDDDSDSSLNTSEADRKDSDYILVPEAQVDQPEEKPGLARTYQGWGEPIPEELLRPSRKRAEGYPLEGESLVSSTPPPRMEPMVDESVVEAPDKLTQVERGELVSPVEPAPDTLDQVERAQLVRLPTQFDEPMTPGPSGRQEPVGLKPGSVDQVQPAPDRLTQVERATLVKLPTKPAPDTLTQVEKGVLIGKAVPVPSRAIQEPADRVPIPNAPIERVGPEQIPNAPPGQAKPEQLPNAPVTPGAAQAKPAAEQETTFMGMPILGREVSPEKISTIPSQPAPSEHAPLSIDADYKAQPGSYHAGRPGDGKIQGIVLHSSDGREGGDINTLTTGGVSSHYYVTRDGRIYQFVNDQDTAYHAGKVVGNLGNGNTIGIEQEHYDPGGKGGKDGEAWSPAQVAATARLVASLKTKYGLSDAQIVGHSDVAPERKQDPYNYPWEDFRRQVNGQLGAVRIAGQPEKGFIKGRATTFGWHDDLNDSGVGAPRLGKINTNEGSLVGIAVPEEALRAQVGANPAEWRKARVEIVTSGGRHMLVPIVDLGPGDVQQTKGIAADFTHGLATVLKHSDQNNYQFRIIPNAGVDVMKNPQAFVAEQAQLAKGADLSPKAKTPATMAMGGYVLVPESDAQKADSARLKWHEQENQVTQAQKLDDMGQKAGNLVGLYKELTTKPPPDINPAVLKNYQDNLKATIIGEMQKRFPDMTPEVAWAKAQENSSLWDIGSEFLHQGTAAFAQLAPVFAQKSPDKEQVDAFLSHALPGASDADKHAWLSKYYALPPDQRGQFIASHLPGAQAGQRGNDPMLVYTALEHLGDPGYQKAQADKLAAARDFAAKARSSDPRLAGTVGGDIAGTGALAEQALAYYGIPIIGAAQASEETRQRLKQEHPDWDGQKLDDSAAYSSLASVYGQTIANTLVTRGAGLLFKTLTTPWKRALAQVLAGTVSNIGVNVGTQALTNVAEDKPAGEGLPGAVRSGAVQGFIPGLVHGAHELISPHAPPPEATTGPKGAPVRGPAELERVPAVELPSVQPQGSAGVVHDTVGRKSSAGPRLPGELDSSHQRVDATGQPIGTTINPDTGRVTHNKGNQLTAGRIEQKPDGTFELHLDDQGNVRVFDSREHALQARDSLLYGEAPPGAPVRGPTERTLEETHPAQPIQTPPSPAPSVVQPSKPVDPGITAGLRANTPNVYARDSSGRENVAVIVGGMPDIHTGQPTPYKVMMPFQGTGLAEREFSTQAEAQAAAREAFRRAGWSVPEALMEQNVPQGTIEPVPPPLPIEAHSDQNLEQRSIPPIRTPEEGERSMTEEEAHAYLDTLSNEIEQRHQARASDIGLIPREENPHATVHDVPPPSPPAPPERFSLGAQVPEKGLSVPEANKIIDAFKEQFPHAPPIEVVGARTELPAHLQAAIAQHAGDRAVEALIHDGRVHVVAGENVSPEQLHKALLEESIGHYGVEQVLGPKFNHLADVVSKSMTGHPQYEALKPVYGDNPRTLAAEYIARAARGQIEAPNVWAHVKTWFNQLARKLGFKRAFSDSELRVLLSRARGRLEKGGGRSVVSLSPPRFRLTSEYGEPEITRPGKEEFPGKHWYSPARLIQGPRWIRSAYDQLSANPHTAGIAAALMHRVDRSQELYAQWVKPIREAFKDIKRGKLKTVLADFAKLQEAKDNKQPQPIGLHPDAYKIERAVRAVSEQVAELAKANKILVFDPRLNNGEGGYRPFRATSDYVPRNVKREVIDAMRLRHNSPADIARWTSIVHDFINKGFATNEAEVIDQIKGAANLDTKHLDSKMGNLEKARVSRLPSNMYEYSLTGMLDYIRRASDRMSEVEAYGQRGELFQKAVDRIEASPLAGSEQGNGLISAIKAVRNRELGLNEPGALGKGLAIVRSFATGMDLSGWMGMFNDLIGSVSVVPSRMGIWNTARGYYHALTHFKQMMSHAEDLGVIHEDYGRATREIEHNYQTGSLSDRLGRIGSKTAELGLAISGRTTQEKFIRTMTLGATKQMLRTAVDTIRKNPTSRQAGAWAHFLHRHGLDVSKLVAEEGEGPESNRLMRRGVANTQAGYDLIQRSPWMESPGGKFFAQYMSWGVNQTRNVMRDIVLPILRPTQKTIDVTVNGKKYTVSDSRFSAIQRGLMLAVAGSATGMLTDQLREFFLGRIQSYRDLKQLAVDIASHPDKAETFAHLANSMSSELLTGGMTGMLGNFAQLVMDPTNKQRYKDPLHPTGLTKLEQVGQFLKRSMQEGQYNSHEADALLKNLFGVYREGKPIAARTMSTLGYSPDWVREERTRQTVAALRNTLRRYNDEQGLGLKPPAFQSDYDASKNTPVAQSVVDALYRGDAAGAKKILADYMKAAPNAEEARKRKDSVSSTVQSATPLKLGSKRNKEFAQGFWDWAQKEGNVTSAQIADYKKAVNNFADTAFNAGFKRELQIVPEEGKVVIAKKVPRTSTTELLREMIRKENAAKALIAH